MSTNKTPNLNLHKWTGPDVVKREEFNDNFTIIDTQLADTATLENLNSTNADVASNTSAIAAHATQIAANNTAITNIGNSSPKGTYATLTALQAAFPTGTTGIYIVTADGNWYYWSGSAWTSGGVYQSTAIASKSVANWQTDFITTGKNLFNKDTATTDKELVAGVVTTRTGYFVTDFIKADAAVNYVSNKTINVACYRADKSFISQTGYVAGATILTPAGTVYIRGALASLSYLTTLQVESGTVQTIYEPFWQSVKNLQVDSSNLPSDIATKLAIVPTLDSRFGVGRNIFDKSTVTTGKTLSGGALITSATDVVSDYIKAIENTNYKANRTVNVAHYDANKAFIRQDGVVSGSVITTPALTSFMRIAIPATSLNTTQLELGSTSTTYEAYKVVLAGVSVEETTLSTALQSKLNASSSKVIPESNYNVACTGSSITWGYGLLDDSYVSIVDDYLRNRLADTLLHDDARMVYSGSNSVITNLKLYKGAARKLTGVNASVEFSLSGNELSIVQGMERSNDGASTIEFYVDGVLYSTFSNFNKQAKGHKALSFISDGTTIKYDLGVAFTYNHVVKRNGTTLVGSMNTATTGATIANDYLIVRKYGTNPVTGEVEVHHWLWLKLPYTAGDTITVDCDYGENIVYAKTTVGERGENINNPLESAYGDEATVFDPANPVAVSAGLDFREVDKRAVRTWRFTESKSRTFKFVVKALDPRATGTPYFILNFATNRMHYLMNAGIGGFSSIELLNDVKLRSVEYLMKDVPDFVFFESGTNDDWYAGKFVSTRTITGMTEAELRSYPAIWLKSSAYVSADNYTVETSVLKISAATRNSVTIDGAGVTFGAPKAGDLVLIGNYYGDYREVQTRIIATWDATNRIATFKKPLKFSGRFGMNRPADLVGREVRIKQLDTFISDYQGCITAMKNYNPSVKIGLVDTGLSNFYSRMLIGYPEKMEEVANSNNIEHVKLVDMIADWQYSQKRDLTAFLNTNGNQTASGASSYTLVNSSGTNILGTAYGLHNFSVKVNGVERYGDECHIEGGFGYYLKASLTSTQLVFTNWNGKANSDWKAVGVKVVFTSRVPVAGDTIVVTLSSKKWSFDDTHLGGGEDGATLFGNVVSETVGKMINS